MTPLPRPGAGIANARGVPGTLGAIGRTLHDGRAVLLSTWHVLFGGDAEENGAVWLLGSVEDRHSCLSLGGGGTGKSACPPQNGRAARIGSVLYGRSGTVDVGGERCYVDCAVAACDAEIPAATAALPHDMPRAGERVTKSGAATGTTAGVIVSVEHDDVAWIGGRRQSAPRQLLVRADAGPFCAEGDSGALLVNERGRAVGLLWGVNSRGEGVACPIAPVLYAMNITL
jgi:hypothetical protein